MYPWRMGRRKGCVGALLLLLVFLAAARTLQAEEAVPKDVREEVELLWVEGRPEGIDEVLAPHEQTSFQALWPLLVRDQYWRAGRRRSEALLQTQPPAAYADRMAWLRGAAGPFPDLAGGGHDPYPILTALIRDRERREQVGFAGLPDESPLLVLARTLEQDAATTAQARSLIWYTDPAMRRVYTGRYEEDPGYAELERQMESSAVALEERNGRWALWSLMGFVLVPLVLGSRLFRRRSKAAAAVNAG